MKQIIVILILFSWLTGSCQNKEVLTYPVLSNAGLVLQNGAYADVEAIDKNESILLTMLVLNPNATSTVKAGTCYLQIELGKKLMLSNNKAIVWPLADYFNWQIEKTEEGVSIIKGRLKTDLPADFMQKISFHLACVETGSSVIKAQWIMPAERIKEGSLNSLQFTIKKSKKK